MNVITLSTDPGLSKKNWQWDLANEKLQDSGKKMRREPRAGFCAHFIFFFLFLCFSPLFPAISFGQWIIVFDDVEGIALDQPRVAVEVYETDPLHSFGPSMSNFWLLDTGAQGILASSSATSEMTDAGYQTVNQFKELGIGGEAFYDVSKVYNFDFAGSDGQRRTLENVRILSSETANFGGFGGIVGMPGLVKRTTSLDLTPLMDLAYMGVSFSSDPLPTAKENRYTAPIQLLDYPVAAGQINPGDALPEYSPLPFIGLEARHNNNSAFSQGFILDTGAQITILDNSLAYDKLGLKEEDAIDYITLGGVGEDAITAPLLAIDQLRLPTNQGIDIVFKDVKLLVLDIAAVLKIEEDSEIYGKIDGIFGSDMITAGHFHALISGGAMKGFLDAVHFDFLASDDLEGIFALDINSEHHFIISEPFTITTSLTGAGRVEHDGQPLNPPSYAVQVEAGEPVTINYIAADYRVIDELRSDGELVEEAKGEKTFEWHKESVDGNITNTVTFVDLLWEGDDKTPEWWRIQKASGVDGAGEHLTVYQGYLLNRTDLDAPFVIKEFGFDENNHPYLSWVSEGEAHGLIEVRAAAELGDAPETWSSVDGKAEYDDGVNTWTGDEPADPDKRFYTVVISELEN